MSNLPITETGASQQTQVGAGEMKVDIKSLNASLHSTKEQHGLAKKPLSEFSVQALLDKNYAAVKEFVKDPQLLKAYGNDVRKLTDEYNNKMQTLTEEYSQYEKDLETLEKDVNAIDPKASDMHAKIDVLKAKLNFLESAMKCCKDKVDFEVSRHKVSLNALRYGYIAETLKQDEIQQPLEIKGKMDIVINAKSCDSIDAADKFISELDAKRKHVKKGCGSHVAGGRKLRRRVGPEHPKRNEKHKSDAVKPGDVAIAASDIDN